LVFVFAAVVAEIGTGAVPETNAVPTKREAFTPRAAPVGAVAPKVFGVPRTVVPENKDALTFKAGTAVGDVPKLAIAPIAFVPSVISLKNGFVFVFAAVVGEVGTGAVPETAFAPTKSSALTAST
jgi:hypothetical protein